MKAAASYIFRFAPPLQNDRFHQPETKRASVPLPDVELLRLAAEINIETFKGVVQLSGFVSSRTDIDKAVAVTRGVSGVKSVKNDMRL